MPQALVMKIPVCVLLFIKISFSQNVHCRTPSKKGKVPWMEYNDDEIADSEFCIEYLNAKHGINLDQNYTAKERGIARAFQKMLEENTYW